MVYLIGEHLRHSYSVPVHEAFHRYGYACRELPPDEVEPFIRTGEYDGLNVTIPYKKVAYATCDVLSERARRIGSVNTVVRRAGKCFGYNTDYAGFAAAAARAGICFAGRRVLVLGSGGASLTVCAVAADQGAREVAVLSRARGDYETVYERHADAEIIVNTTPVGMFPNNGERLIDPARFPRLRGVMDLIYNPLETPLLADARRLGVPTGNGLYMLVAQAAAACGIFCGDEPGEDEVSEVCDRLMKSKRNVVLVGMPGSGKSTVGRALAARLGRPFFDSDAEIERRFGTDIPTIFACEGEAGFRRREREVIADLGRQSGAVIATGGGVAEDPRNDLPLRQNGRVYFISRPIGSLARAGRPLSVGADLSEMYRRRAAGYRRISDCTVENRTGVEACADAIAADFFGG